ncbi:MAG: hypothetical protein GY730_04435 [bacterium]|nr:hypothetical protein [bacterium]
MNLKIPADRNVLIYQNENIFFKNSCHNYDEQLFSGKTLSYWRTKLINELVKKRPELGKSTNLVCSGHQPFPVHPGIWIKRWLSAKTAEEINGQAVSVHLDLEPAGNINWPCILNNKLYNKPVIFPVFWHSTVSKKELLIKFQSLYIPDSILERLDRTLPAELPAWKAICRLLNIWEEGLKLNIIDISQSFLFTTNTMQEIFKILISDYKNFHHLFNSNLTEYRKRNKVKNSAIPFPDLKEDGPLLELPFWIYDSDNRYTLEIHKKSGKWYCNKKIISRPCPPVFPKGSILTVIKRLFLADVYIHGTGGSHYDPVSELFFKKYLNLTIPGFRVASASFGVDNGKFRQTEEQYRYSHIIQRLYDHNPDKLLAKAGIDKDEQIKAAAEKERILSGYKKLNTNRKDLILSLNTLNKSIRQKINSWWEQQIYNTVILEKRMKYLRPLSKRTIPVFYHSAKNLVNQLEKQTGSRLL